MQKFRAHDFDGRLLFGHFDDDRLTLVAADKLVSLAVDKWLGRDKNARDVYQGDVIILHADKIYVDNFSGNKFIADGRTILATDLFDVPGMTQGFFSRILADSVLKND